MGSAAHREAFGTRPDRRDRTHGRDTTETPFRWHIGVFLAPAVLVYTAIMILPLADTLQLSLFRNVDAAPGLRRASTISARCSAIRTGRSSFWNALSNNICFFIIHMLVQNPIGVAAGGAAVAARGCGSPRFYRTAIFVPTHAVLRHRRLRLEADPVAALGRGADICWIWSASKSLFTPWLGKEEYALTALSLISVWQYVGIPMMLIYAALLSIPDEVIEAAECDGITGMRSSGRSSCR